MYSYSTKQIKKVSIPADIDYLIERLKNIKRFDNSKYPKNVFIDDVKSHTLRMVLMVEKLNIADIVRKKLVRTIFIHDIPEILFRDVTALEKRQKPKLISDIAREERLAAYRLLSDKDFELFEDFRITYDYLEGDNTAKSLVKSWALLANVIDRSEGNLFYHFYLTEWINSYRFNSKNLPPFLSMNHAFLQHDLYLGQIKSLKHVKTKYKNLALNLWDARIKKIRNCWMNIEDKRKIPKEISTLF